MSDIDGSREGNETDSASAALYSSLGRTLHAVAQPLTILNAALDDLRVDQLTPDAARELSKNLASEVERVCVLFNGMQGLVKIGSVKPVLHPESVYPILERAADGLNLLFESSRMVFEWSSVALLPPVLIDAERTSRALSDVLLIAHRVSNEGDRTRMITSLSAGWVQIAVESVNSNVKVLDAEARLRMDLATASMRSQHAGLVWSLKPFNVHISLAIAPAATV
jgi:hypothetical protein